MKPTYPTPYEYGLMSKAIYADNLRLEGADTPLPERQKVLHQKDWQLAAFIAPANDYRGGIFVHYERKQVVIAHRGSLNATSWITDYETVIHRKPGGFVHSVLDTLSHPKVLALRSQGYHLSTTGHSLGGFLAQVAVYWAQRREFKDTHYPAMSAMVFDSPGALDFLKVLQSNLPREQDAVNLKHLNIHNFSAMPTIVSTYGTHTGTIWHLNQPLEMRLAFVNAHRMEHILSGFDPGTEQPKIFRQMTDWPQADYSEYNSLSNVVSKVANETIKLPFNIMNKIYKGIKGLAGYERTDTWYDQIVKNPSGQVQRFLSQTTRGFVPEEQDLETTLGMALSMHYGAQPQQASEQVIDLHHFSPAVQRVLVDLNLDMARLNSQLVQEYILI